MYSHQTQNMQYSAMKIIFVFSRCLQLQLEVEVIYILEL
jgi:hypothetical protein